ncbi:MAG: hypothetical protein IKZ47_01205 [Clostridia bacterium]|nr:hypothetical protein [Clostridia bacterium]
MRFPALQNRAKPQTRVLKEFNFGINDEDGDYKRGDGVLKDCLNMQYQAGRLCTRKGFCAIPESVITPEPGRNTAYLPFTVSETVYRKNGKAYNIAYCCTGDVSDAQLDFYFADSEGNILPAGGINFHRTDSTHFYIPTGVFFVVAEPVNGSGVFAFTERKSGNDVIYGVYEANRSFTSWVSELSGFYVPTVRVNGRGERYDEADAYLNLKLPSPDRPEELNLLTGKFKCYYSSDGFSAIFRLPYGIKTDSLFKCRVYSSPSVYTEWVLQANAGSATVTFSGASVTLYLDRSLGVMRFWSGSSNYSVPRMQDCGLNNIEIIAETGESGNSGEIISCKGAAKLDGRMYFYGGSVRGNCVYCTKEQTPLYFPQSAKIFLGDGATPVTSIKVQNGKLIAFKPGETYRIITDFQNENYEKEAVLPQKTTYIKGDVLSAKTIDNRVGCAAPDTVRLCGSRLVWLAADGGVYALATTTYGNTTNIYRISRPLGERLSGKLKTAERVFALTENGQYMLFADETVFVMNYRVRGFGYSKTYYAGDDEIKSPAWYIWKTPEGADIEGGAVLEGRALTVIRGSEDLYFYFAALAGDCDLLLSSYEGGYREEELPIASGFSTKETDLGSGSRLKRLDKVFINGKGGNVRVTVADKQRKYSVSARFSGEEGYTAFCGGIPALGEISLAAESKAPFEVRNVIFKYKKIGEKG